MFGSDQSQTPSNATLARHSVASYWNACSRGRMAMPYDDTYNVLVVMDDWDVCQGAHGAPVAPTGSDCSAHRQWLAVAIMETYLPGYSRDFTSSINK